MIINQKQVKGTKRHYENSWIILAPGQQRQYFPSIPPPYRKEVRILSDGYIAIKYYSKK